MLDLAYFWIGPLGRLTPLAVPEPGVTNTVEMVATEHTSLIASRTYDIHGWRRTWGFTEAYLEHDDLGLLEAYYLHLIEAPLRFIDPLRKNRAFPAAAAGYPQPGWYAGIDGMWAWPGVNGFITEHHDTDAPWIIRTDPYDGRNIGYSTDKYTRWEISTATTTTPSLLLNGPQPDLNVEPANIRFVDPVIPGETLTYSIYLRAHDGALPQLYIWQVPEVGYMLDQDNYPPMASAVASSGDWERVSVTITIPADASIAGIFPGIVSQNNQGYVDIAYGQLEVGSTPTNWVMGLGCPEVAITGLNSVSPRFPLVTADLTIKEL